MEKVFPILTPLAVDQSHPFPYISPLSLNLALIVKAPEGKSAADPKHRHQPRFVRIKKVETKEKLFVHVSVKVARGNDARLGFGMSRGVQSRLRVVVFVQCEDRRRIC